MITSRRLICLRLTCALLGLSLFLSIHSAESQSRVNTKKLTSDLDQKESSLAEEEAKLLRALGSDKSGAKALSKKAAQNEDQTRASIDLQKVAETIVSSETEGATAKEPQVSEFKEEKFVIREEVKESDPELRGQVDAMNNLFNQWQKDFEHKYSNVLESQKELERSINQRIEALEEEHESGPETQQANGEREDKSVLIAELRKELLDKQESFDSRLVSLEKNKGKNAAQSENVGDGLKKIAKDYEEIHKTLINQEQTIRSMRVADGQLKQRMEALENNMGDALKEIDSVKVSVNRIETNLTELSDQFLDSLKYQPYKVHETPSYVDDYPYDWGDPEPRYVEMPHNAVMSDMPMVTVTEETANLWSGPGEDDKIITTIRRGAQLAVEATDQDWYRVIIADGRRAWIPARSVIHNNPVGKDTTLRIASAD